MGVIGKLHGGPAHGSGWLVLFTLVSVMLSNGCWCKDCASLTISLPQPDAQAEDGLMVAVSQQGNDSVHASCAWARTSSGAQPSGSWTCTLDGRTTIEKGTAEFVFDSESAGGTCTFTITDTGGSRSLKREPKDSSSGEATMVGCACDERSVSLTAADLAPQ